MDYKKPSFWIIITCIIILVVVLFSLLTRPAPQPVPPETSSSSSMESAPSVTSESMTSVEMGTAKVIDFAIAGKSLTFSVNFPSYISDYITLNAASTLYENNNEYATISFVFNKGDQTANIGLVSIYPKDQYEKMDPQQEVVPTKLFDQDNLVVAFQGLQDAPFGTESEEGKLVNQYHSELKSTLDTITLTVK